MRAGFSASTRPKVLVIQAFTLGWPCLILENARRTAMKKTVSILLSALLLLGCMLTFAGCGALKKAAQLSSYDFGADSIPSVNSVVGERKVTGAQTGTGTGGAYKEYTYESASVSEDLIAYLIDDLLANNWYALVDFNLTSLPGEARLAMQSQDSGQIIIMDVRYEQSGYTIRLTKGEGTLTLN